MRFLRQSLIGVLLSAVTLALLVYAAKLVGGAVQERMAQERRTPPARERVFAVNVMEAKAGDETPVLEVYGEVASRRTLELRAAAAGRILFKDPDFEDGGRVTPGQILVRIDPADARAVLDRARADLSDSEAELRDAERSLTLARDEETAAQDQADLRARALTRQNDLASRGVGTAAAVEDAELAAAAARATVLARRQSVTQAEARIDQARTRLERAVIAVDEAQRKLDDTTVTAPFAGTLGETNIVEGRLVAANEKLADLVDAEALEVSFRVSTAQYARLLDETGRIRDAEVKATLAVSGIDLEARGWITRASAGAGEGQTGRLVFARLDVAPGFKPGDFVTVQVQEPTLERVVRLPASAYAPDGTVLVLGEEERLEEVEVRLMRRQGDDVLLRGRELPGRLVVRERSPLLGAGIKVRPLNPAGATEPEAPAMVELSDERRAKLRAFVEANTRMPAAAKKRVLGRLEQPQVPARMVERIESQMGS